MEGALDPTAPASVLRSLIRGCDCRVLVFGHIHVAYQKQIDEVLLVDVASVTVGGTDATGTLMAESRVQLVTIWRKRSGAWLVVYQRALPVSAR